MMLNSIPKLRRPYRKIRNYILILPNYLLNETGSRCIELCDGSHTIKQIIDIISAEHNVPNEVVESDVLSFFKELERLGLIELIDRGSIDVRTH